MTRLTTGVDRTVTALVGLVLLAVGVAAAGWALDLFTGVDDTLTLAFARDLPDQGWWRWALVAAGIVLGLLALRWLAAHLHRSSVAPFSLPGSSKEGRLRADVSAIASAAADDLADRGPVTKAKGHAVRDRGVDTIELDATVEPTTELRLVQEAVEATSGALSVASGGSIALRVRIHVARS